MKPRGGVLRAGAGVLGFGLASDAGGFGVCWRALAWDRRRLLLMLALALGAVLVSAGACSRAGAATLYRAYVANAGSDTVTPIDAATNTPGTPIPVGELPLGVAITPNGETAYVTNFLSHTVTPINVATNTPGTPIPVGSDPIGIAITPNGETAYVANRDSDNVTPINLATNTPGTPILVGEGPYEVAITPNGETAYVTNGKYFSETVTPINVATNTPGTPIPVGYEPRGIAITPNGETAYVANFGGDNVTPINLATNTPGTPIPICCNPRGIAITPNGETAYVAADDNVTPINLATNTPGTPIHVTSRVRERLSGAIAITPNGETAYVTDELKHNVTPINLATNTPGTPIPVGQAPVGVAITSVNTAAATCTQNTGTITLSPGLTETPAAQNMKLEGTLTGCKGEVFKTAKYTATLTTAGPVSCSALTAAGELATGPSKYKWTPRARASTGTLSLFLTQTPGVAFSGAVASGSYSRLTFSGTTMESYTGAATCSTKSVKKGTFSGSAVNFE